MPKTIHESSSGGRKKGGTPVRLNRYLSIAGVSSRRKADEYILAGRVSVNGRVVTDLGTKIRPETDSVYFNGKQIVALDPMVYLLLNKPKDCITTLSDEKGRRSVLNVVNYPRRVFPVGRLDRNTTGVLILTNDGDFAHLMMHPRNKVPKSYLVTIDRSVAPPDLHELASGISLADGRTSPATVELIPGSKNRVVGITIREGRNRQIHRMFQAVGYAVDKLDRVAYGPVSYEGLSRGEWRQLSPTEVRALSGVAGAAPDNPATEKELSASPGRRARGLRGTPPGSGTTTKGRGNRKPDPKKRSEKEWKRTPKKKGPANEWKRSPKAGKGPATRTNRSRSSGSSGRRAPTGRTRSPGSRRV